MRSAILLGSLIIASAIQGGVTNVQYFVLLILFIGFAFVDFSEYIDKRK